MASMVVDMDGICVRWSVESMVFCLSVLDISFSYGFEIPGRGDEVTGRTEYI